jgi:acetoin utilization deacetylase AcuC-like enzyme
MLRDLLLAEKIIHSSDLKESPLVEPETLALAHTFDYIEGMRTGSVDEQILKRLGFPWSKGLYERSCASVGGAIAAMEDALKDGIAGNLAGGTHHSHADRGEGYCVFNDLAVATRLLKRDGRKKRIAIIDLDVHQGNGNSSILRQDEGVFIFSMHGEKNYPFVKVPSHLDIALPDGTEDEAYLSHLADGLIEVRRFDPDYIFYQMGVDPLKEDSLGKLDLTFDGLMKRDELVLSYAYRSGIPLSLALGGGYAKPIELSVEAYANTYRVARAVFSKPSVSG